jgi:hypothetical protein
MCGAHCLCCARDIDSSDARSDSHLMRLLKRVSCGTLPVEMRAASAINRTSEATGLGNCLGHSWPWNNSERSRKWRRSR